jgi:hypothetical protein
MTVADVREGRSVVSKLTAKGGHSFGKASTPPRGPLAGELASPQGGGLFEADPARERIGVPMQQPPTWPVAAEDQGHA